MLCLSVPGLQVGIVDIDRAGIVRPMPVLLVLLLTVALSPPFGEASARLIGFTPTEVTIEVSVEVVESAALVLMRGEDVSGQELDPVALLRRADGTWGAVVELPARPDLRIVFELIPARGVSTLSDASSLADLGIDPERLTPVARPDPVEQPASRPGITWVVVAAAAALAALILLTIWSRFGDSTTVADDEGGEEGDEDTPDEDTPTD